MSEVNTEGKGKGKKGKPKKLSTRVDFTPMVDLGFLLITFFMLTTTMIKPQTMEIALPVKDKLSEEDQTKIKASRAVTIILGKDNKIFYYEGTRVGEVDPILTPSDYSAEGIRKFLLAKNHDIMVEMRDLKAKRDSRQISNEEFDKQRQVIINAKTAPIIVIKPTDESNFRNFIDILDEMAICNIGKYAVVDVTTYDLDLVKALKL